VSAPKISVVIPLYNKAPHIKRALESVLAQTVREFEVLVVDDGSTDGGAEIVKGFTDPRLRLISQENRGVSLARNRGILDSDGDLIAFLDADDAWTPGFLETIAKLSESFPQAGAVATAYDVIDPKGRLKPPIVFPEIPAPPWEGIVPSYFRSAMGATLVWTSAVAVRRSVFDEIGGFPEGVNLGQDMDMWLRIALRYPIAYTTFVGATYFMNAVNRTATGSPEQPLDLPYFVRTALLALAEGSVPPALRADVCDYNGQFQIPAAIANLMAGRPRVAREILSSCHTTLFARQKAWWLFWTRVPPGLVLILRRTKRFLRGQSPLPRWRVGG